MAGSAKTTTDHDAIRRWAESRDGRPATVQDTGKGDEPGVLRIDFADGGRDDRLEEITWDDFFVKFEQEKLAFLYEDEPDSRFSKLVNR